MSDARTPQERGSVFERLKRTTPDGRDFWSSRDLARILDYANYKNFEPVITKAKSACFQSDQRVEDHFLEIQEMVEIGSGAQRSIKTIFLSRYACYLIIQNADPTKEVVALGQTYFAVQTRRQELSEQATEDERRLMLRAEMKLHNVKLAGAAKDAGVVEPIDYAIFQNHGYEGLYGGLDKRGIHARKGLKKSQEILDHMGSTELAANLFRATQTEEKLRRDGVKGKVGAKVRQTIRELGGTMPEHLPTEESIKAVERRVKKAKELESGEEEA
ncbi:MAG: DNA damage-inducible protein D [Fimbriimonadaceae bacterium]|nr:DNA damage-inducible protein D [Fimbriimonadaceae bacterium]